MSPDIEAFFDGASFAVVGASNDRSKFGNRVLRCYWQHGLTAHPVNPRHEIIEGRPSFARLADVPGPIHGVSLITPPAISEKIVREAIALGLRRLWFQPGAESQIAIREARDAGMTVIAGGPCVLVELPNKS